MINTALPLKLNVQKAGIVLTAPPNILGMLMELLGCSEQLKSLLWLVNNCPFLNGMDVSAAAGC